MRRLPLLALPLLIASVHAQEKRVESAATLALTLSCSGEAVSTAGRNSTSTHVVPLNSFRLGNREILEALLADEIISEIKGWRVIALWAEWSDADPYAGNGYRFFASRGKGASLETVAIPSSYLALKPLMPAVGYRHILSGETIIGGTEKFTVYEELTFGLDEHAGLLVGLETGTGRYVRPSGSDITYYLPNASKAVLQGTYTNDGQYAAGVVSGTLAFGASKIVTITPPNNGPLVDIDPLNSGGVDVSVGTSGTFTSGSVKVSGSGTLTLTGSTIYSGNTLVSGTLGSSIALTLGNADTLQIAGGAFAPGAGTATLTFDHADLLALAGTTTLAGGTLVSGTLGGSGTFTLGNAGTLHIASGAFAPGAGDATLTFSNTGVLTLGTGEIVTFSAGNTLALSTLTSEQLSTLSWAPASTP